MFFFVFSIGFLVCDFDENVCCFNFWLNFVVRWFEISITMDAWSKGNKNIFFRIFCFSIIDFIGVSTQTRRLTSCVPPDYYWKCARIVSRKFRYRYDKKIVSAQIQSMCISYAMHTWYFYSKSFATVLFIYRKIFVYAKLILVQCGLLYILEYIEREKRQSEWMCQLREHWKATGIFTHFEHSQRISKRNVSIIFRVQGQIYLHHIYTAKCWASRRHIGTNTITVSGWNTNTCKKMYTHVDISGDAMS